ncbi:hypothetical protein OG735_40555 [Streptomyces sp. NBC_01210]|uniref:hypothetical protein n=1 Tax=Streptomyces sp. NBC_01210 TaxID=2903774 RepID=UPI002E10D2E6|nr:hypothetical protein OG735_40555 [Streptomyces sp. NBC_01210]
MATSVRRWTIRDTRQPASVAPKLVTAEHGDKTLIVDPVTGTERAALAGSGWQCRHDAQSLVLCSAYRSVSGTGITVFDASTLKKLWALPDDSGRIVPKVNGFWHGAVYSQMKDESVIVLAGRTGKDRETSPGAAPFEIDPYGGLVGGSRPAFYRAIG